MMGAPLTIAHHFPRTPEQRDTLEGLARVFYESRYSLRTLLAEIASHPYFNLQDPSTGCGTTYGLTPLFDPFTIDSEDANMRSNSVGDIVHPLPTRQLRQALHAAMLWPEPAHFPGKGAELTFYQEIGVFLSNNRPGFDGLGFQARLSWESRYGTCALEGVEGDFIDQLIAVGQTAQASVRDLVITLKGRIVGDASIRDAEERSQIEEVLGISLDSRDLTAIEMPLRLLCGALAASPEFTLGGLAPASPAASAPLLLPGDTYDARCADVAAAAGKLGFAFKCAQ
jgi:hypothetical protein